MSYVEQSPQLSERDVVTVPDELPMILKQFCKAAIRTQPYDLLRWSSSYFRALADGEEPPVKSRLEYPPPSTPSGLTLGFLRVLLRQFGSTTSNRSTGCPGYPLRQDYDNTLPVEAISRRWDCLCLDRRDFDAIVTIGKFRRSCQVKKFLAVAVGLLGTSLTDTMIMICQLFTHEPDGGSAVIPLTLFMELYEYLAGLSCEGGERSPSDEGTITEKRSFVRRSCSINSQDTDMDVNLDSELISKDEADSSRGDLSIEAVENSTFGREVTNCEDKEDTSTDNNNRDRASDAVARKSRGAKGTDSDESAFSEAEKVTTGPTLVARYPNVPGIGPRLSAEQIASVATWMNECAKLQDGMVGPRNIRHTDCPPLHRRSTLELSES